MKLFFLLAFCYSIKVLKPMSSTYILASNEYYSLNLDDYFAGDQLSYSINPTINVTLQNPGLKSSSAQSLPLPLPDFEYPSLMQILPFSSDTQKYIFFGVGSSFHYFLLNLDTNSLSKIPIYHTLNGSDILQYQILEANKVLLLVKQTTAYGYKNSLYYWPADKILLWPKLLSAPEIENLNSNTIYLSKGEITDTILITGYEKGVGKLFLYNVTGISHIEPHIELIASIIITDFTLDEGRMMALITNNINFSIYYVYVPKDKSIIKIEYNEGFLEVSKVLYLDAIISEIYSMELSYNQEYIMIGTVGGFAIISLDLEQVFIKRVKKYDKGKYFITTTESNNFALVFDDDFTYLQVSNQNRGFYVLGDYLVSIKKNCAWNVVSYYSNRAVLIYTNGSYIN